MSIIRFMSHNQWNNTNNRETWEKLGLDCSSKVRSKGHATIFEELMPDIVGAQEVNKEMQADFMLSLLEKNINYTMIWGNLTPIFYRMDKFELLDNKFMLYPIKTEGYDGICNDVNSKTLNVAVFKDKQDNSVFVFATTHLWYKSEKESPGSRYVRLVQFKMAEEIIKEYQVKYNNCPAIFVGDFNSWYDVNPIKYALIEGGWKHAHDIATDFKTECRGYCGCGAEGPGVWDNDSPFEKSIDHVLVKDVKEGAVKRFERYCPDYYLYLSDHAPAVADIEI